MVKHRDMKSVSTVKEDENFLFSLQNSVEHAEQTEKVTLDSN